MRKLLAASAILATLTLAAPAGAHTAERHCHYTVYTLENDTARPLRVVQSNIPNTPRWVPAHGSVSVADTRGVGVFVVDAGRGLRSRVVLDGARWPTVCGNKF